MKILLVGAAGQLAHDCRLVLQSRHEVIGVDLPDFDITRRAEVLAAVQALRPQAILNCAAYTRVDDAESHRDLALRVNVDGAAHLAEAAAAAGALLLHVSTDYVFDGQRPPPAPYRESDAPAPRSVYGESKWLGEQAIRERLDRHAIVRTAWLYGRHGGNFPKTMLRLALTRPDRPLRVVADQFGCPTWSHRLALQLAALIEHDARGLFHATGSGHTTWHDFAAAFLAACGVAREVLPCSTSEYPTPAARPMNSILVSDRLREIGGTRMAYWRHDVEEFAWLHGAALRAEVQT